MKNQSLNEGVGLFLADKLKAELTDQVVSWKEAEFEFVTPEEILPALLKGLLGEYYSANKELQLVAFDELSMTSILTDGSIDVCSIEISIIGRVVKVIIEEL